MGSVNLELRNGKGLGETGAAGKEEDRPESVGSAEVARMVSCKRPQMCVSNAAESLEMRTWRCPSVPLMVRARCLPEE